MTTLDERPVTAEPPGQEPGRARGLLAFLTTADHKRVGISYMATAYVFYVVGGALALVVRTELAQPGTQVVSQGRYNEMFSSKVADINNTGTGGFAGSITAALFLKRFVENTKAYVHFDVYGWVPSARPARPLGGEPQAARALFALLSSRYPARK